MSREYHYSRQAARHRQNARMAALARPELRRPSDARVSADGAFSHPIKKLDPETQALIDAALKEKSKK